MAFSGLSRLVGGPRIVILCSNGISAGRTACTDVGQGELAGSTPLFDVPPVPGLPDLWAAVKLYHPRVPRPRLPFCNP